MTTGIPIIKTSGTGNQFVLIDARVSAIADPVGFARRVCDRTAGFGADGVLLIEPSAQFDARMRIINADGSEAEMCGNGMRCVARYLDEHDGRAEATVETPAGPIGTRIVSRAPYRIAVEMGEPRIGAPILTAGYRAMPYAIGASLWICTVATLGLGLYLAAFRLKSMRLSASMFTVVAFAGTLLAQFVAAMSVTANWI